MIHKIPNPPPGFDDLSVDERLDYVQSLWDRIAAKPEEIQVPDWHRKLLDERLTEYQAHPDAGRPWEEVRDELRRKIHDQAQEQ